jgi:predicted peptidase
MMNTLVIAAACTLGAAPSDEIVAQFEEHAYTAPVGEDAAGEFRFRLLKPDRIEPDKQYPVVLFLHGAGERGDDNKTQLRFLPELLATPEYRRKFPCFVVAPQCRTGKWWVVRGPDKKGVGEQMKMAEGVLAQVLHQHPVDPRRVYLTGISMGAFASWNLAVRHPDWFAAVVPIAGGGDPSMAAALVDVPVWAVHSADDKLVPAGLSRAMVAAIRQAGGTPKYTELDGFGHESWMPAYEDPKGVLPWMFEQVNGRHGASARSENAGR